MSFLAPSFLWLLPMAAAPLILHLLNKRPPKLVHFSHIKWIQDAHRKRMPKKKIKDILLLLSRMGLLLFLVLFFARPVVRQGKLIGGQDDNATLLVLLDVSASMGVVDGGQTALARASENVRALLRDMPLSARVGLVSYSDRVEKEFAPTSDRSKVLSFLDDVVVVPHPTDVKPALDAAYAMLARQPKSKKSILVLSDNQSTQWNTLGESRGIDQFDPTVSVVVWETVGDVSNHGVTSVSLNLTQAGTLKGGWLLDRGPGRQAPVAWSLILNDGIVGRGTIQASKPNELLALEARLPKGGAYAGSLALAPDAAAFDNTYYVAGRIPKGFRALVVEGETGLAPADAESYYLKLALESPRDPRVESLRVLPVESFTPELLATTDVLVLANVGPLKNNEEVLRAWVENGGRILLTAGARWQGGPSTLGLFNARDVSQNAQRIKPPEDASSLGLTGIDKFEWNEASVSKYVSMDGSGATTVLSLANGEPLLISRRVGKGWAMALATSIDRAWTNLPSKPVFSPLVRELLSRLADPVGDASMLQATVDTPFDLRLTPGLESVSIIGPDGTSVAARVDTQGRLRVPPPAKPGLYRVSTSRKVTDVSFATNMARLGDEGNYERMDDGRLHTLFPNADVQIIGAQTRSDAFVENALEGVDATPKLLVLIVVFLLIETWLGLPRFKSAAMATAVLLVMALPSVAGDGNRFVFAQLKYDGAWDPYPNAHDGLFEMITNMTNIPLVPTRRVVELSSPMLFEAPTLFVKGNTALNFNSKDKTRLKQYIDRGGFVFFDDTLADPKSPFAQSVRALMHEFYPSQSFQKLPMDHAVFRSFFLLRAVSGRRVSQKFMEGIDVGGAAANGQGGGEGRTAVIYCSNDLMGAWIKDNLGQYVYSCEPGGEAQRWESFKLALNVVYFSLTGTYKKDAIHQPFIEKKLGM